MLNLQKDPQNSNDHEQYSKCNSQYKQHFFHAAAGVIGASSAAEHVRQAAALLLEQDDHDHKDRYDDLYNINDSRHIGIVERGNYSRFL